MRYGKFKYADTKYAVPVFVDDRTEQDVANRTPKAHLNATDLNRIEYRCSEIVDMLRAIGYDDVVIIAKTNWIMLDLCRLDQMERVRCNVELLINTYNHEIGQPVIPHNLKPKIEDLNSLEESLKLLDKNSKHIAHQWRSISGVTVAGGGIRL